MELLVPNRTNLEGKQWHGCVAACVPSQRARTPERTDTDATSSVPRTVPGRSDIWRMALIICSFFSQCWFPLVLTTILGCWIECRGDKDVRPDDAPIAQPMLLRTVAVHANSASTQSWAQMQSPGVSVHLSIAPQSDHTSTQFTKKASSALLLAHRATSPTLSPPPRRGQKYSSDD
jgi:hypothetical protein